MAKGEAAGDEGALFRSGPLRPAFEREVLEKLTFGFKRAILKPDGAVALRQPQTYTGSAGQNRARATKSWTTAANSAMSRP
jgi:hypothetical protein